MAADRLKLQIARVMVQEVTIMATQMILDLRLARKRYQTVTVRTTTKSTLNTTGTTTGTATGLFVRANPLVVSGHLD